MSGHVHISSFLGSHHRTILEVRQPHRMSLRQMSRHPFTDNCLLFPLPNCPSGVRRRALFTSTGSTTINVQSYHPKIKKNRSHGRSLCGSQRPVIGSPRALTVPLARNNVSLKPKPERVCGGDACAPHCARQCSAIQMRDCRVRPM